MVDDNNVVNNKIDVDDDVGHDEKSNGKMAN